MTFTENTETMGAPPTDAPSDDPHGAIAALLAEATASVALDGDTQSEPTDTRLSTPNIDPHEIIRRIGQPVVERDGRHWCPVCNVPFEHAQALGPHFRLHWQEAGVALKDIPNVNEGRFNCPECSVSLRRGSMVGHLHGKHGWERPVANGLSRTFGFDLDAYLNPPPKPEPEPKAKTKKHKPNYEERQLQFVVCPFGECGAVHRRKYMIRHLRALHDVDRMDAPGMARSLPATNHKKSIQSKLTTIGRPRQSRALDVIEPDSTTPPPSTAPLFENVASAFDFTAISPTDIAIGVVQSQLNGTMPTAILPDVIVYVDHTRTLIDQLRATRGT